MLTTMSNDPFCFSNCLPNQPMDEQCQILSHQILLILQSKNLINAWGKYPKHILLIFSAWSVNLASYSDFPVTYIFWGLAACQALWQSIQIAYLSMITLQLLPHFYKRLAGEMTCSQVEWCVDGIKLNLIPSLYRPQLFYMMKKEGGLSAFHWW